MSETKRTMKMMKPADGRVRWAVASPIKVAFDQISFVIENVNRVRVSLSHDGEEVSYFDTSMGIGDTLNLQDLSGVMFVHVGEDDAK